MIPEYHGSKGISISDNHIQFGEQGIRIEAGSQGALTAWNIAMGYFSPCNGFHGPEEIRSILEENSLPDGTPWSVPLVLPVNPQTWESLHNGDLVEIWHDMKKIAIMEVEERFTLDLEWYTKLLFSTNSDEHPGVMMTRLNENRFVSGRILSVLKDNFSFIVKSGSTEDTRRQIKERGPESVCGFQTRNAPHRGHEFLHKQALSWYDSLALTPSLGPKKKGDLPDALIISSYRKYLENYLPVERVFLFPVNYAMIYAGPREAFLHMVMRKNMGCSHFIIGRDHAGTGKFYGKYEAMEYVKSIGNTGITPVFMDEAFYCSRCGEISTERICPHPEIYRKRFSGTLIREMIEDNTVPDGNMMRAEIFESIAPSRSC